MFLVTAGLLSMIGYYWVDLIDHIGNASDDDDYRAMGWMIFYAVIININWALDLCVTPWSNLITWPDVSRFSRREDYEEYWANFTDWERQHYYATICCCPAKPDNRCFGQPCRLLTHSKPSFVISLFLHLLLPYFGQLVGLIMLNRLYRNRGDQNPISTASFWGWSALVGGQLILYIFWVYVPQLLNWIWASHIVMDCRRGFNASCRKERTVTTLDPKYVIPQTQRQTKETGTEIGTGAAEVSVTVPVPHAVEPVG